MLAGKPSRRMWIAALVVSVICVAGLTYALIAERDTPPTRVPPAPGGVPAVTAVREGSGFSLGLLLGLGGGVVIGSLLALRKRET